MGTQFAITLTVLVLAVDILMLLITFLLGDPSWRKTHRVGLDSRLNPQVTLRCRPASCHR